MHVNNHIQNNNMVIILLGTMFVLESFVQSLSLDFSTSRRHFFTITSGGIIFSTLSPQIANSACLPSDTAVSCIGVYKVPIDDAIAGYIDTPENLRKLAPDLKWVPPPVYPTSEIEAVGELKQLREDLDVVIEFVKRGELTKAGVEVLRMVPRITVDGRVVIRGLQRNESLNLKAYRFETAHSDLLIALGSVDVLLGQGISGQLGSITMAQILCLQELERAKECFIDLVKSIPPDWVRL